MMRHQGKVTKWVDDKGYGFISADGLTEQVFVHVSAFAKTQERPFVGEAVTFEVAEDAKKGLQAYNVLFPNRPIRSPIKTKPKKIKRQNNYSSVIVIFALVFGYALWGKYKPLKFETDVDSDYQATSLEQSTSTKQFKVMQSAAFQCSGKKSCSEMTSCAEATYYLNNCPGTVMDGDGDGRPCEDQWCGH